MEKLSAVRAMLAIGPGIALLVYALRNLAKDWESRGWPTVEAQVQDIRRVSSYRGIRHLHLTYTYSVSGQRYIGNRYSFGWPVGLAGDAKLDAFVRNHRHGSKLQVHYNPNNSAQAVIEPGPSFGNFVGFAVAIIFLFFGLLVLRA